MANKRISQLTNTITAFRTGDYIAVDGTDTAKMAKDDLLRETAENALAGNVAKKFNTADDFGAGENVIYNGSEYVIIKDHTAGSWASSDAYKTSDRNISELGKGQLFLKKSLDGNEVIVPSLTKYYVINDLAQKVSLSQNFGSTTDIELHAGKSIYVYCACNRYVSAIAEDLGGDTYQVLAIPPVTQTDVKPALFKYKNETSSSKNIIISASLRYDWAYTIVEDGVDIDELNRDVDNIECFMQLSSSDVALVKNAGSYINQYGVVSSDAYHYMTDPISLSAGGAITFYARGTNTIVSVISCKNSDNTYTPLVVSTDSNLKLYSYKNESGGSINIVLSFKANNSPSTATILSSAEVELKALPNISKKAVFSSMDDIPYGSFNVANSASLTNKPFTGDFTCLTFGNKERTYCVQLAYGATNGFEMKRKKYNGTWYPWERVLDEKDKLNFESIISTTCGVSFAEKSYTENTGKYVQFDGQLVTLAAFSYSDDIVLKPNETIVLLGVGASTNVAMISVHDLYYTCVARSIDSALRYYHYTNESGKDQNITISFNNRYKPSKVMVFSQPDVEMIRPSISLFDDIGCLGDSFTDGILVDSNHVNLGSFSHKYSWPSVMKKHFGITHVENYGVSGATTRSAKTNANQLPKILSDSPRQLYLLCLGINDCWQMPAEYLGSESDINTSDYTQSADTYYGNYYYIIEAIKEHAPDAIIILMLPHYFSPDGRNDFLVASKRIAEIAEVTCIETYKIMKYPTYTNLIGSHPTITGYALMAEYYAKLIEEWMVDKNLLNLVGAE